MTPKDEKNGHFFLDFEPPSASSLPFHFLTQISPRYFLLAAFSPSCPSISACILTCTGTPLILHALKSCRSSRLWNPKTAKWSFYCLAPSDGFSRQATPSFFFLFSYYHNLVYICVCMCASEHRWKCTWRTDVAVDNHSPALFQLIHLDRVSQSSPELPNIASFHNQLGLRISCL